MNRSNPLCVMESQPHFASWANEGVISLWLSFDSYTGIFIHVVCRPSLKLLKFQGGGAAQSYQYFFFSGLYFICYNIVSVSGLFFQLRGMWDTSSPVRDQTHIPCIERQSPNHCTTRKAHLSVFLKHWGAKRNMLYPPFSLLDKSIECTVHVFSTFNFSCFHHSYFFFLFFFFLHFFFYFYFIFKHYNIVLVLPNIEMNPPQVYMCSPT